MLKKRYNTRNMIIIALGVFCSAIMILVLLKGSFHLPHIALELIGLIIAISLAFIVFSLTTGRDAVIVNEPSDYPPVNITPPQAGCIQDGTIDEREIISTIFFLAHRGYFIIKEYELQKFEFTYMKYPIKEDRSMRLLFNAIFGNAQEGDTVKLTSAQDRLIKAVPEFKKLVLKSITSKKNKEIAALTGKVNGFIESLINNSPEHYEEISQKDDDYFYKIIPYVYTFAIASKIPSKFEKIDVKTPDWYIPYGTSENYTFNVVIYSAMLRNLPKQLHLILTKG